MAKKLRKIINTVFASQYVRDLPVADPSLVKESIRVEFGKDSLEEDGVILNNIEKKEEVLIFEDISANADLIVNQIEKEISFEEENKVESSQIDINTVLDNSIVFKNDNFLVNKVDELIENEKIESELIVEKVKKTKKIKKTKEVNNDSKIEKDQIEDFNLFIDQPEVVKEPELIKSNFDYVVPDPEQFILDLSRKVEVKGETRDEVISKIEDYIEKSYIDTSEIENSDSESSFILSNSEEESVFYLHDEEESVNLISKRKQELEQKNLKIQRLYSYHAQVRPFEIWHHGVKIYDSSTYRFTIEFNSDHVKILDKKYLYSNGIKMTFK